MPGYTESKIDYFKQCQEQKEFIVRCSIVPTITPSEHQRIVRILGGAERLLVHPFDEGFGAAAKGGRAGFASVAGIFGAFGSAYPGLFSFLTEPRDARRAYGDPDAALLAESRATREFYATLVIKHFPRYLTGHYSALDGGPASRNKVADAASKLVTRCEAVVAAMEPLGDVAARMLGQVPRGQRASRVQGAELNFAFNDNGGIARYE